MSSSECTFRGIFEVQGDALMEANAQSVLGRQLRTIPYFIEAVGFGGAMILL